ncbi:HlyC/CorC family transporter [Aurantimonas sp. Leaf443]|uniref:HlyC/CorC family transporter n=1 Tax=Aurantimonas sp. Leaf443 TaxID=1736378 RepID=UPI0006F27431|nr:HlyC/CorC family transporter [Aurantimonas sp. Leaf443]KQT85865.1 hypothetical protein ASG48_04440 [Aurantimonas sp. Leaf443]
MTAAALESPQLWWTLSGVLLLVAVSAFFAAARTATTALSAARIQALVTQGVVGAPLLLRLTEKKDRLIGALVIGGTLVDILAAALAASSFLELFGPIGLLYAILLTGTLVVVFGQILPRSVAIARPESVALRLARPVRLAVLLLAPPTAGVNAVVRFLLRAFGTRLQSGASMLSAHEELRGALEVLHREGALVNADRNRLGGLLDLHELEVLDVMVHRTTMRTINAGDAPAEIVRQVLDSPYTRLPVWKGASDNIVGVVHAKDVLRAVAEAGNDPAAIDILKVATPAWFVPETTTLQDQLNAFLRRKMHFAVVVDEYGEVEGLVTLEDILEEIVGDIADEHDIDVQGVRTEADGSVVVDGQVPIRDLNRALDWTLPDDEAVTIAGLVIHEAQTIPEERQAFTFFQKRFTVLKRDKNRIATLRIRPASVVVPVKRVGAPVPVGDMHEPAPEELYEAYDEGWHEAGEADFVPLEERAGEADEAPVSAPADASSGAAGEDRHSDAASRGE